MTDAEFEAGKENIKTGLEAGYKIGYEQAKKEFERPHGEWIPEGFTNDRGETYYHCSLCFAVDKMDGSQLLNYCWKCGADMRGENYPMNDYMPDADGNIV